MTPHEISAKIFYSPDANGKAEESIKEGALMIQLYVNQKALSFGEWIRLNQSKWNDDANENGWCRPRSMNELYGLWWKENRL